MGSRKQVTRAIRERWKKERRAALLAARRQRRQHLLYGEWAGKMQGYDSKQEIERKSYGHFYYRFNGGESCADVYDRISNFFDSLFRDFEKKDFPKTCAIVSHGMALRVFLMRWFHLTVEEFELLKNPMNCSRV